MPSAPEYLKAKFPGSDAQAMKFLESHGFCLTGDWTWKLPSPDHIVTEDEWDAIEYLVLEWDFGGLEES